MKNDVEQLMSSLRSDHRNMVLLLDLLDAEINRLAAAGEPDFDLVRDIMLYMTEYPDAVHHPKEDIVYRHLKSLRPDIDADLARVETDHRYIEESGTKLKTDIEAMSAGENVDRDKVVKNLRHYMEQLREHMYWEETELFSLADELQHDGDWSEIVSKNDEIADPLFGPRVGKKFRKLMARIQQRAVWDSQQYMP